MKSELFNLTEINDIPEVPGIYSWYLLPKRLDEAKLKSLYKAFNELTISLDGLTTHKGSAKFGEKFIGLISRIENEKTISSAISVNSKFLLKTLHEFIPPLYIGRSVDIRRRISQHFESYVKSQSVKAPTPYTKSEMGIAVDNEEESNYFGQRLASFNDGQWFNENELFIKVFDGSSLSNEEIVKIEYFLNRTFRPLLGIN